MRSVFAAMILLFAAPTFAQEAKAPATGDAHIRMHEQMADAHRKAADCLKAGRPADECRAEMQKTCMSSEMKQQCGAGGCCGMMGGPGKGMGKGKGMGHGMKGGATDVKSGEAKSGGAKE